MGIKRWIFLQDAKPAFKKLTSPQNGWIIDTGAVQHVWRTLKRAGFDYLETRSLNQDPLENTFGVIHLRYGSNNNPNVGQFVRLVSSIALHIQVCIMQIVRVKTLSVGIIYIPSSRNLVLLH